MRTWMSIRSILDLLEEEVAIRAGLLLSDHDVFQLLRKSPLEPWVERLKADAEETIGIRPEFLEEIALVLRAAVGNIPEATPASVRRIRIMKQLADEGLDPGPVIKAFSKEIESGQHEIIGQEVCDIVRRKTGASVKLVDAVFYLLADNQERSASVFSQNIESEWDTTVPLGDLFGTEAVPSDPAAYLDQRFLDFLASRPQDLERMHWRNFERLTAEFFARQGYEIALGPGTKDGGVDIRVWPKGASDGPPLILIQCKRYAKTNLVEVEYVKALWADVTFEEAERGMIATTSRVTPEGKRMASARKYSLDFAEAEQVTKWVTSMWRQAWRGKGKTEGVGMYLVPPFYPIRSGDLDFLESNEQNEEG